MVPGKSLSRLAGKVWLQVGGVGRWLSLPVLSAVAFSITGCAPLGRFLDSAGKSVETIGVTFERIGDTLAQFVSPVQLIFFYLALLIVSWIVYPLIIGAESLIRGFPRRIIVWMMVAFSFLPLIFTLAPPRLQRAISETAGGQIIPKPPDAAVTNVLLSLGYTSKTYFYGRMDVMLVSPDKKTVFLEKTVVGDKASSEKNTYFKFYPSNGKSEIPFVLATAIPEKMIPTLVVRFAQEVDDPEYVNVNMVGNLDGYNSDGQKVFSIPYEVRRYAVVDPENGRYAKVIEDSFIGK